MFSFKTVLHFLAHYFKVSWNWKLINSTPNSLSISTSVTWPLRWSIDNLIMITPPSKCYSDIICIPYNICFGPIRKSSRKAQKMIFTVLNDSWNRANTHLEWWKSVWNTEKLKRLKQGLTDPLTLLSLIRETKNQWNKSLQSPVSALFFKSWLYSIIFLFLLGFYW